MADRIWPMSRGFLAHFLEEASRRFSSLSQGLSREPFAWSMPTHSFLLGGLQYFWGPQDLLTPLPWWSKNKPTYHMIMITNFITISFKMLKNSTISLACSPIFPMAMPKAMKNPIRPVGWMTLHRRTNYKVCFSYSLPFPVYGATYLPPVTLELGIKRQKR